MAAGDLFSGDGVRVFATPASASALDAAAAALIAALPDVAERASALVLAPNRRAARAFAARLVAASGAGGALLPTIRPLGDLGDEPDVWGGGGLDLEIAPAIDPLRRRLELASLIRARDAAEGGVDDPSRAIAAADALCDLLDSAAAAEAVDWAALPGLVEEAELAAHWRRSAAFLDIVATHWPRRLAEDGLLDPGDRRTRLLEALAARLRAETRRPVLALGSTGSIAAVRSLMATVARLPRGAVILPGLDVDLDEATWARIGPQHPQFALKRTLATLGVARSAVRRLGHVTPRARAREALLREALAPPEATADWLARIEAAGGAAAFRAGFEGLRLVEADTDEEEASVCALLLREALERPEASAALVTPDADLARRVCAKLARWGVAVGPSAGRPLLDTGPGRLIDQLLALVEDCAAPVALAGFLRNPLVTLGLHPEDRTMGLDALDRPDHGLGWRGPRRWSDLADFAARAAPGARLLLERARAALEPLARLHPGCGLDVLAEAVGRSAELAAGEALWTDEAGQRCAGALETMLQHGAALGPCRPAQAVRVARALLQAAPGAPDGLDHPRLFGWGPLEARLLTCDRLVLAGLVEGRWPAPPPEDPFLSRRLRTQLGLPDPDERIGLSAHDFAGLAAAGDVFLVRAKRSRGTPTVASRWLWRLTALAQAAGMSDALTPVPDPRLWARALDWPPTRITLAAPTPRPPPAVRPRRLSVSDVGTLIRDPYAIYARHVLGLRPLAEIGARPGAPERGEAIHEALAAFSPGQDAQALIEAIAAAMADRGFDAVETRLERVRLVHPAETFLAWDAARGPRHALAEQAGERTHPDGWTLHGRADRIEWDNFGRADVIDFKTGSSPSVAEARSGLAPQLALLGAILAAPAGEGFAEAPNTLVAAALGYWRFRGRKPEYEIVHEGEAAREAAVAAWEGLADLLAAFQAQAQPYLSKPRAKFANAPADYDLLARRGEWAAGDGEEA